MGHIMFGVGYKIIIIIFKKTVKNHQIIKI
jgi:hypothetical protein